LEIDPFEAMADTGDVEKGLDRGGDVTDEKLVPLRDSSSSLEESSGDVEEQSDRSPKTEVPVQSNIVDWDGPDDPEHPQNLYVYGPNSELLLANETIVVRVAESSQLPAQ
jgi:hypothetical protein